MSEIAPHSLGPAVPPFNISEALDEVRQHFNIDDTLIWNKNESPSLKMAFCKYQAYISLCAKFSTFVWPDEFKSRGLKKPSPTELINIFTSTTNYHEYYKKNFSKVIDGQHLDMIDWLSDKDDALSDQEMWDFSAASYNFEYLKKWLGENGVAAEESKSKGKSRKMDSDESDDEKKKKKQKTEDKDKKKKKKKSASSSSKR